MNTRIKKLSSWLNLHPKLKQLAWFIVLWLGGLFAVLALSYLIRLLLT